MDGICFVHQSIVGHRYGMHRPLVVELPVAEFEILLAEAKSLDLADVPVMEKWYQKDDNALPPVYVLQVGSALFHTGSDKLSLYVMY